MSIASSRGRASRCGRGAALLLCMAAAAALPVQSSAQWKPEKSVELVAMNAPGGGSDRILRLMLRIIIDQKISPAPVNVVNKPGGGGAIA